MKEKDTKRKVKKINLNDGELKSIIEVNNSQDYLVALRTSEIESTVLTKKVNFRFTKSNISSDIKLRLVLDSKINIKLLVKVITPFGVENASSRLDMKAIILDDDSSVTFVPMLEIDEKDVSVDHQSTIGAPDQEVVNYMRSRGVTYDDVKAILAEAFLSE